MSRTNVFFCLCGRQIGRPSSSRPDKDAPPIYNVVPWHARVGDGKLHGIKCGSCRRNWLYRRPKAGDGRYVEVENCCDEDRCTCRA